MWADTDKSNTCYDLAKGRPFSQFHFHPATKNNIVTLKTAALSLFAWTGLRFLTPTLGSE
jgi:hypothetical protein